MFIASLSRFFARRVLTLGLIAGGVAMAAAPQTACAQTTPPTKVAVVNVQRAYNEMQETKALTNKMNDEQKKLQAESDARQQALQKMRSDREQFKAGTTQWSDQNKKLIEASVQFEMWAKTQHALMEDAFKQQVRQLFEKVQGAVAEVAKRDNIDIVINDTSEKPEVLDQADLRTLKTLLTQKTVLFTGEKSDITTAVIILLDAKYKAQAQGK